MRGASRIFGILFLLLPTVGCGHGQSHAAPEVRVGDHVLVGRPGIAHAQVTGFLGIPYAEPPLGVLRWQAPQPARAMRGRRPATEFAAACYQDDYNIDWYRRVGAAFGADPGLFRNPPFSEDCLYLNVWTLAPGRDARLPVMVWIHGGANRAGWSFEPNYLGENLAARGKLVVVSIAYRHGVFGFFGHPELGEDSNFGLLDQIAALRWVQEHIASFGGDARNVTVFGESAGAANIGYLLASPMAEGLFRRAISQSGGYQMLERRTSAEARTLGVRLSETLPLRPDLAGLRRLDSATILAAANSALKDHDWGPAVDGTTVPAHVTPQDPVRNSPVDLFVGSNQDEWYMYVDDDPASLAAALDALPAAARSGLESLAAASPDVRSGHDRATTFANMVCPGYLMAGKTQRAGGRSWVYRFTRVRPGPGGIALRAYHGAEIPYVFDTHDAWLPTDDTDRRLTETLMGYWTRFAWSGDPNADGLPAWPVYDAADAKVMALGDEIAPRPAPDHALCREMARDLYGARP